MEEGADRLGQDVPAAVQKRREKAVEAENLNQRCKKNIEECVSCRRRQSALSAAAESRGVNLAFLAALAASFLVAYLPTYLKLAGTAWRSEQEGHGPLIMLAAVWLAWQQRDKLRSVAFRPAPVAGWIILLLSLLLMAVTRSQD